MTKGKNFDGVEPKSISVFFDGPFGYKFQDVFAVILPDFNVYVIEKSRYDAVVIAISQWCGHIDEDALNQ